MGLTRERVPEIVKPLPRFVVYVDVCLQSRRTHMAFWKKNKKMGSRVLSCSQLIIGEDA
jgi:hypothetical protein